MGFSAFALSQHFELISSADNLIALKHQLSEKSFENVPIDGVEYTDFSINTKTLSSTIGSPALPFFTTSLIVPNHGHITLSYSHDGYEEFNGIKVTPSKGDLKRNVNPADIPYTFGASYTTDSFYPNDLVELSEPFNLRTTRGVTVKVNPYQYNPVTEILRIYKNIKVHLQVDSDLEGLNELNTTAETPAVFAQLYAGLYLNNTLVMGRYSPKEEEGDLLIIAGDSFLDEIEPLATWKTQKGIRTTVVGTAVAGTTDVAIKAYISNAYATNPNLVYVLLVGDHPVIPAHTYGYSGGEQLWSDSFYGQLTGGASDFYPELFIGRFSGESAQLKTMVERTLAYEKNPADGDWMTKAIGLASSEGAGYGDDGESDWQHARNNRAKLLEFGYTHVYEFYDGTQGSEDAPGNPTSAMISAAVNEGVGLFNYTGHGDMYSCLTGNYGATHINAATNNGNYPFVISVACNNGSFTTGTCFSETLLNATNEGSPSGAIAACGSTILMAWAQPMQTQDEMTNIISEQYVYNKKETLGGIFYNAQMSMLEEYFSSTTAKEVMQTWVFFGDPSTVFRNKITKNITASHLHHLPLGASALEVTSEVEGAITAIVQNGELIGRTSITGGTTTIYFDALVSDQPLLLTLTKQNHKPYQLAIRVGDGPAGIATQNLANVSVYPNPADNILTVLWEGINTPTLIELKDLSGHLIYKNHTITASSHHIDVKNIAPGLYLLTTTIDGQIATKKIIIN